MIRKIEEKIINDIPITINEANTYLKFICEIIRKDSNIHDCMDSDCKVCYETSTKFGILMLMKLDCDTEKINIKDLLKIPLTHHSNIVSFNVEGNRKTYLVDMTYSQFFGDIITLDNNIKVNSKIILKELEQELFVENLRKNGFIELEELTFKKYIDVFLNLCNIENKKDYYTNVNKFLTFNKIDFTIKEGVLKKTK